MVLVVAISDGNEASPPGSGRSKPAPMQSLDTSQEPNATSLLPLADLLRMIISAIPGIITALVCRNANFPKPTRPSSRDLPTSPILVLLACVMAALTTGAVLLLRQLSLLGDDSIMLETALGEHLKIGRHIWQASSRLHAFLDDHFKDRPGTNLVTERNYRILIGGIGGIVVDESKWAVILKARARITMAMLIHGYNLCPRCRGPVIVRHRDTSYCAKCDREYHSVAADNSSARPRRLSAAHSRAHMKTLMYLEDSDFDRAAPAQPIETRLSLQAKRLDEAQAFVNILLYTTTREQIEKKHQLDQMTKKRQQYLNGSPSTSVETDYLGLEDTVDATAEEVPTTSLPSMMSTALPPGYGAMLPDPRAMSPGSGSPLNLSPYITDRGRANSALTPALTWSSTPTLTRSSHSDPPSHPYQLPSRPHISAYAVQELPQLAVHSSTYSNPPPHLYQLPPISHLTAYAAQQPLQLAVDSSTYMSANVLASASSTTISEQFSVTSSTIQASNGINPVVSSDLTHLIHTHSPQSQSQFEAPIPAGPPLYHCPHTNCTSQPFATQYLLNSHLNVHGAQSQD